MLLILAGMCGGSLLGTTGYVTSDTNALGQPEQQTVTYSYYSDNLLQSVTDSLGRVTSFDYDSQGNAIRITGLTEHRMQLLALSVTMAHSDRSPASADPLGHTSTFSYDPQGNLTTATDPLNHSSSFGYNPNGQLASVTDALNNTVQFGYYAGDLTTVIDPLGNLSSQFTDEVGRVTSATDAQGSTW